MVSIANDGTVLEAVACTAAAVSSALSTATYHLFITPVVFGTAVTGAVCGGTTTVGFDPSAAALAQDATEGGPTPGATVCYGAFPFCGASPPNGVTCFTPAAGAYTQTAVVNSSPLFAESCLTGFLGQGAAISQSETGTTAVPYALTQTPDRVLQAGEWTAANQFASSSAGVSGGFAHNATILYFEMNGFAPAIASDTVVYLSDGTAANTTTTGLGGETIPFPAHLAVVVTSNTGVATGYTFTTGGGVWAIDNTAVTGFNTRVQADILNAPPVVVSNIMEFSLPIVSAGNFFTTGNVFVAGSFVAGFGGVPTVTGEWPQFGGAWGYVADVTSSCQPPSFYVK